MSIYTKKGDKGKTSFINKQKVWKNSLRTSAYGSIDELNSLLGVVISEIDKPYKKHEKYLVGILKGIQDELFYIGSSLANPESIKVEIDLLKKVTAFEKEIDKMTAILPKLSNFILPGGGEIGSFLQLARSVCRRAEREVVSLYMKEKIDEEILAYLNRLSDLLFTMSRFANYKEKVKETIWKKR